MGKAVLTVVYESESYACGLTLSEWFKILNEQYILGPFIKQHLIKSWGCVCALC